MRLRSLALPSFVRAHAASLPRLLAALLLFLFPACSRPPAPDDSAGSARQANSAEEERARLAREAAEAARAAAAPGTRGDGDASVHPDDNPNIAPGAAFSQVRVFYGTDRAPSSPSPGDFGGGRSTSGISYGSLVVSVPRDHRPGRIESSSVFRLEFSDTPEKHMVILRRAPLDPEAFRSGVRAALARSGESSSFVFIHGYNVPFDDAAKRTAQITFDLDFAGAPVFFSWPSLGSLQGYATDENNAEWSVPHLKEFLREHAESSGSQNIYLIAHSMGNRVLVGALRQLFTEAPGLRGRFREIILTAPDIDAEIFKRDHAPMLSAGCDQITLYVSDGDKALLASRGLHGYHRVGDASQGIVVIPGIETIDASGLDTSFLEHSYFAEAKSVLTDIRRIVREGLRASARGLEKRQIATDILYWKFDVAPAPAPAP